jgi:hypothetical protein
LARRLGLYLLVRALAVGATIHRAESEVQIAGLAKRRARRIFSVIFRDESSTAFSEASRSGNSSREHRPSATVIVPMLLRERACFRERSVPLSSQVILIPGACCPAASESPSSLFSTPVGRRMREGARASWPRSTSPRASWPENRGTAFHSCCSRSWLNPRARADAPSRKDQSAVRPGLEFGTEPAPQRHLVGCRSIRRWKGPSPACLP